MQKGQARLRGMDSLSEILTSSVTRGNEEHPSCECLLEVALHLDEPAERSRLAQCFTNHEEADVKFQGGPGNR
jgi:hypothetical protein